MIGEGAPVALDDLPGEPYACADGCIEVLALDDLRDEAAYEGVAGAIGVDDEVLLDQRNGELALHRVIALLRNCHEDRVLALSDNSCSCSLGVDLGPLGDGECHVLQVCVFELVGVSEALGFVLVAKDVVSI